MNFFRYKDGNFYKKPSGFIKQFLGKKSEFFVKA